MAKKEKFGKFVLLEEIDSSGLGSEFRSAKLGATGLEKIVSVLRLTQGLSNNADVAKGLMDQAKVAAQLQNPNVLKIYGIGKVDWAYYISYEFIEGKSLKAIFKRCRAEGFPFSVDHALLIASKVCTALEYAHGRKSESGSRYFHGLVNPGNVIVSYEGEVRTRGFGYWPSRVREAGVLTGEDQLYLAPEQAGSEFGDHRSDIFSVGAVLFETLTGHALFEHGRSADPAAQVAQAKVQSPSSDDDALPKPLADILHRALAADPGSRYSEIQEMRKAIDTLLFSGDFTPTTFNLAFFMHSLFREDIERESKMLKEEKEGSYVEYLTDEARPTTKTGSFKTPTPPPPAASAPTIVAPAAPAAAPGRHDVHEPRHAPPTHHAPAHPAPAHAEPPAGVSAKEAAAGFTFHKDEKKAKSKAPLFVGLAAVLLIGLGVTFYLLRGGFGTPTAAPTTAPTTLSAEAVAALARVKELEGRLKAIDDERKQAEAKAAEDTKRKMEQQAAAKGQQVDPAALAKAQEEAARKARVEQERKAEDERRRLEEQKKAEEARLAEEQRRIEEQRKAEEAARLAVATPPPTTAPAPTQPVIRPGTLVNLSDPGVTAPVPSNKPQVSYPPIAQRQRVEGTVELNALVDENGNVVDAQIVKGAGGRAGLNEAAIENVKKRKYRPAMKDGVVVKVWIPVRVDFKLPT